MTKYLLYTGLAVVSAQAVFALQISEIMYDPSGSDTGYEWIEIHNDAGVSIDITKLKLLEAGVKHSVSAGIGGNVLEVDEYAILSSDPAKFMSVNSSYKGKVFDSTYSLSNTGESLSLLDINGNTLVNVSYTESSNANGTGGSVNFDNGIWTTYLATPGRDTDRLEVVNTQNTNSNNATNTNSSATTSHPATSISGYVSSGGGAYTLGYISILTAKSVQGVVGSDTAFSVVSVDPAKPVIPINTFWSFGDGSEGRGATTTHKYLNPGRYTVFVECEVPNAYGVERIQVNIIMPDITITEVGENYILIKNNSTTTDINIGGFHIASDQGVYKLSRNLLLQSKEEMRLDGRVLGFGRLTNVKLLTSAMSVVSVYNPDSMVNVQKSSSTVVITKSQRSVTKPSVISSTSKQYSRPVSLKSITIPNVKNNIVSDNTQIKNPESADKNTTARVTSTTETVYSSSIKKGKNWLYWLYEQ